MISAFRMGRLPMNADCVISIEYNSELLNNVSKNWEKLALPELPNLLTRDLVNSELYSIDITLSAFAGCRPHMKSRNLPIYMCWHYRSFL